MKKVTMLLGMALCVFGVMGIMATSYFDAERHFGVKTDHAIILSLDRTAQTASLTLTEDGVNYAITAKIAKSSGSDENANATLRLKLTDESETMTLDNVTFAIFGADDTETALKTQIGAGEIAIDGINETTHYLVRIYLTPKQSGERYDVSELTAIGGKMEVAFTSAGGNA